MSEQRKAGRIKGATELATIQLREAIAGLYLQGHSVADICQRVDRSKAVIYNHLTQIRLDLIRQNKTHFDERLALHLDDALDTLGTHHSLLQDDDFLRTADPERLKAIGSNLGTISDKCYVLLAAAGRGKPAQPEGQASPESVSA